MFRFRAHIYLDTVFFLDRVLQFLYVVGIMFQILTNNNISVSRYVAYGAQLDLLGVSNSFL